MIVDFLRQCILLKDTGWCICLHAGFFQLLIGQTVIEIFRFLFCLCLFFRRQTDLIFIRLCDQRLGLNNIGDHFTSCHFLDVHLDATIRLDRFSPDIVAVFLFVLINGCLCIDIHLVQINVVISEFEYNIFSCIILTFFSARCKCK